MMKNGILSIKVKIFSGSGVSCEIIIEILMILLFKIWLFIRKSFSLIFIKIVLKVIIKNL